jgi:hypothetical protein
MTLRFQLQHLVGVLGGSLLLLAATPTTPNTMYLRMPDTSVAASVNQLSYDAIATVPQAARIPLASLPQQVEATLVVPSTASGPFSSGSRDQRYVLWTIVETDADGAVVKRTAFHDVTISSIRPTQTADGTDALRVRFTAASVVVTQPRIAKTG